MNKRRLSIIISLVILLLLCSGTMYFYTYNTVKSKIAESFNSNANDNTITKTTESEIEKELSEDSKPIVKIDTKESNTKTTSAIAKEGVNFNYVTYSVKIGDTLFSLAKTHAPSLNINDVKNNIIVKNNLDQNGKILVGQKLIIPESVVSKPSNN